MLCDNCKHNEATILIKEIHNGSAVSINLCAECARKKEQQGELGSLGFNLAEVLFDIGKLTKALKPGKGGASAPEMEVPREVADAVCPRCGWSAEKIRENEGLLGCPECYRTFAPLVEGAVARIQRGMVHIGKRPSAAGPGGAAALRLELERLQRELTELIRREEYEAAAVNRDRIAALKRELGALEAEKK